TKGVQWHGEVARFKLDHASIDDVTVHVSWGDGYSDEDLAATLGDDGYYHVIASHTYQSAQTNGGNYVFVSIGGDGRWMDDEADLNVTIDKTRINVDPVYANARQLEEFTAKLATFTSPVNGAIADQFNVTIDWGDGSTSAGAVSAG